VSPKRPAPKQPRATKARALPSRKVSDEHTLLLDVDALDIVSDKRGHARDNIVPRCERRLRKLGHGASDWSQIEAQEVSGMPIYVCPRHLLMEPSALDAAVLRAWAEHYAENAVSDAGLWHFHMRRRAMGADREIFHAYLNQVNAKQPRHRDRGPVWRTVEMLINEGARDAAGVLRKLSDPDEMDRPGSDYPIVVCSDAADDPIRWYPRGSDEGDAREATFAHIRSVVSKIKKTVSG